MNNENLNSGSRAGLPPGPTSPRALQTVRYVRKPFELLDECRQQFGPLFSLRLLGMGDIVMVARPADLKTLFTGDADVLHAGEANFSVFGAFVGPGSTFMRDGDDHRVHKQLMLPVFASERMEFYAQDIVSATRRRMDDWVIGEPFSMQEQTRLLALDVILDVVFGVRLGGDPTNLGALLTRLVNVGFTSSLVMMPGLQKDWGRFSPWGRILHLVRRTDAAIFEEIRNRRQDPDLSARRDVLSLLLGIRKNGVELSEQEIRDELIGMLIGGHEAVGTPLAWIFERILSQPEIQAGVYDELTAVFGDDEVNWAGLQQLDFLDAVIRETFRTRSVMPNGGSRVVKAPFEIGGYTIPAGVTVSNCMYLLHRDPEIYPQPDEFRPERFLGKKTAPYEWTPFGGGIRHCLGMGFALMQMRTMVAAILHGHRLRVLNPNARMIRNGFFLAPEDGPRVELQNRAV